MSKTEQSCHVLQRVTKNCKALLLKHKIEACVIFGSLLGQVRHQYAIHQDNDVDFLVEQKYYEDIKKAFSRCTINIQEDPIFLQINYNKIAVDFYFYKREEDKAVIPWHWWYKTGEPIRIPWNYIHPIKQCMPSKPVKLVEFLYGPHWRMRLHIGKDYHVQLNQDKPETVMTLDYSDYWKTFYDRAYTNLPTQPSPFALFVSEETKIGAQHKILDVGCGNARDSIYFNQLKAKVIGYDTCEKVIETNRTTFPHMSFSTTLPQDTYTHIYCRWILHALSPEEETKLLNQLIERLAPGGFLCVESRSTNDAYYGKGQAHPNDSDAFIYGHYRRFLRLNTLKEKLQGLDIIYEKEGHFSPFQDDNPTLLRIIAQSYN